MSAAPVISVLLPVHNGEKYLSSAVDSILAQSFADFELLIIDDGSTDNSLAILRDYEKKDARIRLKSRENKGLVASLNEMIGDARGVWIARMDADDIAFPQRFARQLEWLQKTGADVCGSRAELFGAAGSRILRYPQSDEAIKAALLFDTPFAHPSVMIKTERAKALGYDGAWNKAEDYDLWERAARVGWRMTNVPEVLVRYRRHGGQISLRDADRQQELTQKIRRRRWEFVFDELGLNHAWIGEVLKLRDPASREPDMDSVDQAFAALLRHYRGEAQAAVFDHATRLYLRAAGRCPNIVARWSRLNEEFGTGAGLKTKFQLGLLRAFRLSPDNRLFHTLKNFYFMLAG